MLYIRAVASMYLHRITHAHMYLCVHAYTNQCLRNIVKGLKLPCLSLPLCLPANLNKLENSGRELLWTSRSCCPVPGLAECVQNLGLRTSKEVGEGGGLRRDMIASGVNTLWSTGGVGAVNRGNIFLPKIKQVTVIRCGQTKATWAPVTCVKYR